MTPIRDSQIQGDYEDIGNNTQTFPMVKIVYGLVRLWFTRG